MRYARTLLIGLVATVAFAWSAAAIENADELAGYCQSLERGAKGAGRHIYIPSTREALTCWGYMQAMQDLSVLADENGHRIMGACPPEQTTTLQLIRSFVRYARANRSELPGNAVVVVIPSSPRGLPVPLSTVKSKNGKSSLPGGQARRNKLLVSWFTWRAAQHTMTEEAIKSYHAYVLC